jgi:hypothetical protein
MNLLHEDLEVKVRFSFFKGFFAADSIIQEKSMADINPKGQERTVNNFGRAAIDGAPIAYIIVLAAVVTTLAFIPFSITLGVGGSSFPMNQVIFGLIGWVLGPLAGAVTSGIGALIGVFVAPHTSFIWFVTVIGAVVGSFSAGIMRPKQEKRKAWWLAVAVVAGIALAVYLGRAILINQIAVRWAIFATFVNWSSLVLFILPTRRLVAKWIGSHKIGLLAAGLAIGTWISFGIAHTIQNAILYSLFNWQEETWVVLSSIIPIEFLLRCAIAAVIGTGVITGLRAIGLVKPSEAVY